MRPQQNSKYSKDIQKSSNFNKFKQSSFKNRSMFKLDDSATKTPVDFSSSLSAKSWSQMPLINIMPTPNQIASPTKNFTNSASALTSNSLGHTTKFVLNNSTLTTKLVIY